MLVKKKNSNWRPNESPDLAVGATIEITDPKALIISGDVVGLADDGFTELSAYELYGVIVEDEMKDYQDFLKMKKAEATKVVLEKQVEELKEQIKEPVVETPKETVVEVVANSTAKPAVEVKKSK